MSFFEPLPAAPEPVGPYGPTWAPPAWDRPSEAVLPAIVPVNALLGKGEQAALILQSLRVYPTGVALEIIVMRNPRHRLEHEPIGLMRHDLWPRIGVQFADGRRAGERPMFGPMGVPKDEDGYPTEPVLTGRGGGGGGTEYHMNLWLFPLPPVGPFRVFAQWQGIGLAETSVELDGGAIREAAASAVTVWD